MKTTLLAAFVILLMTQCSREEREVAPSVAKLVGTWQLVEPDSAYAVTLLLALDTANPPNDIIHFKANGKSAINTYNASLSAAVDGLMVVTSVGSTKIGGSPEATTVEQAYFASLRDVVRYELPTDNRLRLYYGGNKSGVLVYKKIG
ncbi:META domain-containing protein [Spirosoma arcticum]